MNNRISIDMHFTRDSVRCTLYAHCTTHRIYVHCTYTVRRLYGALCTNIVRTLYNVQYTNTVCTWYDVQYAYNSIMYIECTSYTVCTLYCTTYNVRHTVYINLYRTICTEYIHDTVSNDVICAMYIVTLWHGDHYYSVS